MQRLLVTIGLLSLLAALLWPWLSRLPFGRLPGDIIIDRPDFKLLIPITSMVLLSLLISPVLWLFRR